MAIILNGTTGPTFDAGQRIAGDDTSAIVAEKQRLRDITSQVDGVTTLDELKQITV